MNQNARISIDRVPAGMSIVRPAGKLLPVASERVLWAFYLFLAVIVKKPMQPAGELSRIKADVT
jgi:hypothetical protein